jgi:hypothetical protein
VLGLMPETGIRSFLRLALPDPAVGRGIPRAELYLVVDDTAAYHARAREAGAAELSQLARRSWGTMWLPVLILDGHVVAFAVRPSRPRPTAARTIRGNGCGELPMPDKLCPGKHMRQPVRVNPAAGGTGHLPRLCCLATARRICPSHRHRR